MTIPPPIPTGVTEINGGNKVNINNDNNLGAAPALAATNISFTGSATLQAAGNIVLDPNRIVALSSGVTATFDTDVFNVSVGVLLDSASGVIKTGPQAHHYRQQHLWRHHEYPPGHGNSNGHLPGTSVVEVASKTLDLHAPLK